MVPKGGLTNAFRLIKSGYVLRHSAVFLSKSGISSVRTALALRNLLYLSTGFHKYDDVFGPVCDQGCDESGIPPTAVGGLFKSRIATCECRSLDMNDTPPTESGNKRRIVNSASLGWT